MKLKKLITLFLLCTAINSFSQNKTYPDSFVLLGNIEESKRAFYTKSIEAADFEQFRAKTQTVSLKFKNGFLMELLPAKELVVKGIERHLDLTRYSDPTINPNYKLPLFEIQTSGWITAEIQHTTK